MVKVLLVEDDPMARQLLEIYIDKSEHYELIGSLESALFTEAFCRTHAVDLRYYDSLMGQPFDLADYVQTHCIDRVLLIGNVDYFTMNDFALEN